MTTHDIETLAKSVFNEYFNKVRVLQKQGFLTSATPSKLLYPTHLLTCHVEGYYIVELIGASEDFTTLTPKGIRPINIDILYAQLEHKVESLFHISGKQNTIKNAYLATGGASNITVRFPYIEKLFETKLQGSLNIRKIFSFTDETDYFCLENTIMVNAKENTVRIKYPAYLLMIKETTNQQDLITYWKKELLLQEGLEIRVVRTIPQKHALKYVIASQFATIFLLDGIRETTLGDFLNTHKEIIHKGLNAKSFMYEPTFYWQTHEHSEDNAINPDLMVERQDGYYDIYDLKLPLLNKAKLTKGERRRRQFINDVDEGRAQLAHYAEYFSNPLNLRYLEREFKVKINNPSYYLIVGNYENYDKLKIEEARRGFSNFNMIDYDTLLQQYVLAE